MPKHIMTRAEYDKLQPWSESRSPFEQMYRYSIDGYVMVPTTMESGEIEVKLEKAIING